LPDPLFPGDSVSCAWHRVLACGALLCIACGAQALELADDRGVAVRMPAAAARIVTLAPHLAELVYAAGAGPKLAGVARFSDFPPDARALPEVGDAARVDAERILALKPDLVLAWKSGNQAADITRLEDLGVTVFVTEPTRLADIPRLIRAVGTLAGSADSAVDAAAAFEQAVAGLRHRHATRPPVRVFYEIWHRPLITVNGKHFISDVIALCGGVNVFDRAPLLTPTVSLEAVLAAHPEAIIGGSSAASAADFVAQWRAEPVAALRAIPVAFVPADAIQRAGPRLAAGASTICAELERVRALRAR